MAANSILASTDTRGERRPVSILLNAAAVFGISLFLLYVGLYSLLLGDNGFAFVGAFLVIPPGLCLAWWQYHSVFCRSMRHTQRLAIASFALAGFLAFGLIGNALEYMFKSVPTDRSSVGPVGFAIILTVLFLSTAYFALSGFLNWNWYKRLRREMVAGRVQAEADSPEGLP
jgi:ABC-type Na+ efflux pump permease subunit